MKPILSVRDIPHGKRGCYVCCYACETCSKRIVRVADFVIPIVIAVAAGALVNYAGGKWIDWKEEQSKEKVYSDTMIGAAATENVLVVTSIEEMFEEDFFTFYCHIPTVRTGSYANYNGVVYDVYKLESGENVLVDDYIYNQSLHVSPSDTYDVMPIGRVVKEPVPQEIIEQLEENGYTLTDPSFYVDMRGDLL